MPRSLRTSVDGEPNLRDPGETFSPVSAGPIGADGGAGVARKIMIGYFLTLVVIGVLLTLVVHAVISILTN